MVMSCVLFLNTCSLIGVMGAASRHFWVKELLFDNLFIGDWYIHFSAGWTWFRQVEENVESGGPSPAGIVPWNWRASHTACLLFITLVQKYLYILRWFYGTRRNHRSFLSGRQLDFSACLDLFLLAEEKWKMSRRVWWWPIFLFRIPLAEWSNRQIVVCLIYTKYHHR